MVLITSEYYLRLIGIIEKLLIAHEEHEEHEEHEVLGVFSSCSLCSSWLGADDGLHSSSAGDSNVMFKGEHCD